MFSYVISIHPERKSYFGVVYTGEDSYGRGVDSLEEADALLSSYASAHYAKLDDATLRAEIYTGRYTIKVRKPCRACAVTGIKAGCKRKKCPECDGRGTTDIAEHTVDVKTYFTPIADKGAPWA